MNQDPSKNKNISTPYKTLTHDRFTDNRPLAYDSDEYDQSSDKQKKEFDKEVINMAQNAYEQLGGKEGSREVLATVTETNNASPYDQDVFGDGDEDSKDYYLKPTDKLELLRPDDIMGPAHFLNLPKRVQSMYILSIRANAAGKMYTGSSYDNAGVYGRLPASVVEQEEELYDFIVCEKLHISREELTEAAQAKGAIDPKHLLPQEVSFSIDISSPDIDRNQAFREAMQEYLHAAVEAID